MNKKILIILLILFGFCQISTAGIKIGVLTDPHYNRIRRPEVAQRTVDIVDAMVNEGVSAVVCTGDIYAGRFEAIEEWVTGQTYTRSFSYPILKYLNETCSDGSACGDGGPHKCADGTICNKVYKTYESHISDSYNMPGSDACGDGSTCGVKDTCVDGSVCGSGGTNDKGQLLCSNGAKCDLLCDDESICDIWDLVDGVTPVSTPLEAFEDDKAAYEPSYTSASNPGFWGNENPDFIKWVVGNHDMMEGISLEEMVNGSTYIPGKTTGDFGDYAFTIGGCSDGSICGDGGTGKCLDGTDCTDEIRAICINNINSEDETGGASQETLDFLRAELNDVKPGGNHANEKVIIFCHAPFGSYPTGDTTEYVGDNGVESRTITNIDDMRFYFKQVSTDCNCEQGCWDDENGKYKKHGRLQLSGGGFEDMDTCRFAEQVYEEDGLPFKAWEAHHFPEPGYMLLEDKPINYANDTILGITVTPTKFYYRSKNSNAQRKILQEAKNSGVKILGVFSGHNHIWNIHEKDQGIDYYTIRSVAEAERYVIVEVMENNILEIKGFGPDPSSPDFQASFNYNTFRKAPYLVYPGSNNMTVQWQLFKTVPECTIYWGTDPENLTESAVRTETGSGADEHQYDYTITGFSGNPLTPGTQYFYEVDFIGLDEPFAGSFYAALPDTADTLRFMVYGETHSNPDRHDSVAKAMIKAYEDPATGTGLQTVVIGTGGLVNERDPAVYSDFETDWDDQVFHPFKKNISKLKANMPVMSCKGSNDGGDLFNKYLLEHSSYGPGNNYYSFDYGPARFIFIDQSVTYTKPSTQYTFVKDLLDDGTKEWNFICLNEPGWSAGRAVINNNNVDVQNLINDLIADSCDVDAVFAGHNGYFSKAVVDHGGGKEVVHITTGGGGAQLHSPNNEFANITSVNRSFHYCEVTIDSGGLTITPIALGVDGQPEPCWPPESGDWVINESCKCEYDDIVNGNIIVGENPLESNVVLTIGPEVELGMDFQTHNLTIHPGAGVYLNEGAKIY